MDAIIIYIDEEGTRREVLLSEIRKHIAWEYGIPVNVLYLSSDYNKIEIIEIKVISPVDC